MPRLPNVAYGDPSRLGAIVHATCDALRATFGDHQTESGAGAVRTVDLVAAAREADARHPERARGGETGRLRSTSRDASPTEMLTERVVRGKDEYPTTLREMRAARAEAAASGDVAAAAAIAADAPLRLTRSAIARARFVRRAETKTVQGGQLRASRGVLHAGESANRAPRRAGESLGVFPEDGGARARAGGREGVRRGGVDVRQGTLSRRAQSARRGRFGEAVVALEKAERLDPKNKQVAEALRMAGFKARQHAAS